MSKKKKPMIDPDSIMLWIGDEAVFITPPKPEFLKGGVPCTKNESIEITCEGLFSMNYVSAHVECPLCTKQWQAVFPVEARELECPKCGNMVEPIFL
jgi:Zn finger protein HypA/HybF involved in hydrogenase expression